MKKKIVVLLISVLLLFLNGCSIARMHERDMQESYSEGWSAGYSEGYEEGYMHGYWDGEDDKSASLLEEIRQYPSSYLDMDSVIEEYLSDHDYIIEEYIEENY